MKKIRLDVSFRWSTKVEATSTGDGNFSRTFAGGGVTFSNFLLKILIITVYIPWDGVRAMILRGDIMSTRQNLKMMVNFGSKIFVREIPFSR